MKRSQLEKIYFKKRTQENFKKYKNQKNYCSRLYKRQRKSFFESIDSSEITKHSGNTFNLSFQKSGKLLIRLHL